MHETLALDNVHIVHTCIGFGGTSVFYVLQNNPQLSNIEFGRRLAVERELEKTPYFSLPNACEHLCSYLCEVHAHPSFDVVFAIF